jgi:tetratricopeptide (TPR) repeat protein
MKTRDSLTAVLLLALCAPASAATAKPPAKAPASVKTPAPVKTAVNPPAKPAPAPPEPLLPPADPVQLVTQARAAAARGETDLALLLAGSAIVADPARPSSYDALGDLYAAGKQPEFARNFYDKALAIDPADAAAAKAIAALDRAGDKTAAADAGAKP